MNFIPSLSISGVNATGTRINSQKFFIDRNMNQHEVWDPSEIINTQWCLNLSFILFFLVMYLNHRLYSRRSIKSCRIIKTRYSIRRKGPKAKNTKSQKKNLGNLLENLY